MHESKETEIETQRDESFWKRFQSTLIDAVWIFASEVPHIDGDDNNRVLLEIPSIDDDNNDNDYHHHYHHHQTP